MAALFCRKPSIFNFILHIKYIDNNFIYFPGDGKKKGSIPFSGFLSGYARQFTYILLRGRLSGRAVMRARRLCETARRLIKKTPAREISSVFYIFKNQRLVKVVRRACDAISSNMISVKIITQDIFLHIF